MVFWDRVSGGGTPGGLYLRCTSFLRVIVSVGDVYTADRTTEHREYCVCYAYGPTYDDVLDMGFPNKGFRRLALVTSGSGTFVSP